MMQAGPFPHSHDPARAHVNPVPRRRPPQSEASPAGGAGLRVDRRGGDRLVGEAGQTGATAGIAVLDLAVDRNGLRVHLPGDVHDGQSGIGAWTRG